MLREHEKATDYITTFNNKQSDAPACKGEKTDALIYKHIITKCDVLQKHGMYM